MKKGGEMRGRQKKSTGEEEKMGEEQRGEGERRGGVRRGEIWSEICCQCLVETQT